MAICRVFLISHFIIIDRVNSILVRSKQLLHEVDGSFFEVLKHNFIKIQIFIRSFVPSNSIFTTTLFELDLSYEVIVYIRIFKLVLI